MGVAIVLVLSLIAIPIVLSPKSRPIRVCDVLIILIKSIGLVTKAYKLKIDKNTTLKIAKLSRLRITDEEIEELSIQLSSILDWVEQLNEVNTDNVKPLSNVSSSKSASSNIESKALQTKSDVVSSSPKSDSE